MLYRRMGGLRDFSKSANTRTQRLGFRVLAAFCDSGFGAVELRVKVARPMTI